MITLGQTKSFEDHYVLRDRVPNNRHETGVVYNDGKTYLFTARPWDSKFRGYGCVLVYDEKDGFYPAAIDSTKYLSNADNHLTTKGEIMNDEEILIIEETDHGQNINVWISKKWPIDFKLKYVLPPNNARGSMYPFGDSMAIILQRISVNAAVTFWDKVNNVLTPPQDIFLPYQAGKRIYWTRPIGKVQLSNGMYVGCPQISTSGGHEEYGLVKTYDFKTYYSWDGTESFNIDNGPVSSTLIQHPKFKVCGRRIAVPSLPNFLPCISDDDDSFIALFFDDQTLKLYIITHNGTDFVHKETTLPNGLVPLPITAGVPDGSCIGWMYHRDGELFAVILVQEAEYRKHHLFSTTDMGDTWTDHGDMMPGVNAHFHKCSGPVNHIPASKKFAFWLCEHVYQGQESSGFPGRVHARDAWIGELPVELTPIQKESWKMIYDASSANGTTLEDKTENEYDANGIFAVNDGFIESSTSLTLPNVFEDDEEATVIMKVKHKGVNQTLLSFATTTNNFKFFELILSAAGKFIWRQSQTNNLTNEGRLISIASVELDQEAVIAFVMNKAHVRMWVNGVETNKIWDNAATPSRTGRWVKSMKDLLTAPCNSVRIGGRKAVANYPTPVSFSFFGYIPYSINPEAISKQLMQ